MKCQPDCLKKTHYVVCCNFRRGWKFGNRTAALKCSKIITKFCRHYISVWKGIKIYTALDTVPCALFCFILLYTVSMPSCKMAVIYHEKHDYKHCCHAQYKTIIYMTNISHAKRVNLCLRLRLPKMSCSFTWQPFLMPIHKRNKASDTKIPCSHKYCVLTLCHVAITMNNITSKWLQALTCRSVSFCPVISAYILWLLT